MKIFDFIKQAQKYIIFSNSNDSLKKISMSNKKEHYILVPNSITIFRKDFAEIFKKYYLAELFEISNCFLGSYKEPYMFLHLVSNPIEKFKISVYEKPAHLYIDDINDPDCGKLRVSDRYTADFLKYLGKLDQWRIFGKKPEDIKYEQQFRELPWKEFNREIIYTRFYLDYNSEARTILKNEQLAILSDVAEVIPSYVINIDKVERVKALDANRMPKYPYIPELDTIIYPKTSVQLKKGDIVEHHDKFFLVDKEADFEVYAPPATKVIRANKNISSEYLYLYLTSKIAWRIRSVLTIPAGEHMRACSRRLDEFPIVLPKEQNEFYVERFLKISSPDERVYQKQTPPKTQDNVNEILQKEIIETIRLNNEELLRSQIDKDLNELNKCYEAKAYKSAIMLAGAILETFLLDWISELDGVDYFETEMKYQRKDGSIATADL